MAHSEARLRLYGHSLWSYEKVEYHKQFLEIDFRGPMYENLVNFQIFIPPQRLIFTQTTNTSRGPKSKISSHTFVQHIKCFPKWYVMTHQHQQPWRRCISSRCPNQRQGSDGGPMKKLQNIKSSQNLIYFGGLFYEKLANLQKNYDPLIVWACIIHQCGYRSEIKNPLSHYGLSHQMLSKMVGHDPVPPTTMDEIDYREKDCMQAQS